MVKKSNNDLFILSNREIKWLYKNNNSNNWIIKTIITFNQCKCLDFSVVRYNENKFIIYFGEYKRNDLMGPVKLFAYYSDKNTTIEISNFDKNFINHIHSIIPDLQRKQLFILTGDFGERVGIYIIKMEDYFNYSKPIPYKVGSQIYRAAWGYLYNDELIYATDSQIDENYLIALDIKNKSISKLAILESSSIYSFKSNYNIYFSTVVEPKKFKNRSVFNYFSKNYAFNMNYYYLYNFDLSKKSLIKIQSKKKSFIPAGISGFGTYKFCGQCDNFFYIREQG
ncbi:hypothetical protein ICV01_01630 [Polynucleobacter sp. MWH-Spelu-300-X4]|uniref:hypothetical protein n=1 Tax=Polynucleobacter sp. MWH-Spelu-300-X4 TaxID=2689109 RepID=UPI001BFDF13B|nr:hypothetical protein [Polynucleobacter sp. MWH-Spelu-300-X4]QWD80045.1 hypothetical protein ICV01_01630 [Polynucleobacter sp. MWH-Spelu-300-X4]